MTKLTPEQVAEIDNVRDRWMAGDTVGDLEVTNALSAILADRASLVAELKSRKGSEACADGHVWSRPLHVCWKCKATMEPADTTPPTGN